MEKKIELQKSDDGINVQLFKDFTEEEELLMLGALCMTLEVRYKDDGAALDHMAETLEICAKNVRDRKMP